MTLVAKISMCLALWNPDVSMHSASEGLLSHWYNQTMAIVEYNITGETPEWMLRHQYLSFEEFQQYFSLPNSEYRFVPVCIQQASEEA